MQGIKSFALYGFPESHAASFALIAYASAYLKAHHGAAFLCALLNNWPMGFYHPATLVTDAARHGIPTLPIDVQVSSWHCTLERDDRRRPWRCGWGCATCTGCARRSAGGSPPRRRCARSRSLADFHARVAANEAERATLAEIGAFARWAAPAGRRCGRCEALGRSGPLFDRGRRRRRAPIPRTCRRPRCPR